MFIPCLEPERFQSYLTETVYKDEFNLTRYIGINHEVWIPVLKEKYVKKNGSYSSLVQPRNIFHGWVIC
jgi:hypothetical protein